jgi:hypothetical protein
VVTGTHLSWADDIITISNVADDTITISNVFDDTITINNYNQVPSRHLAFLLSVVGSRSR